MNRAAISAASAILSLAAGAALACPPSMNIGTYAINNYTVNGSSGYDLTHQVSLAEQFFAQAQYTFNYYRACPSPVIPVNRLTNKVNQHVTADVLKNNSSGITGDRESNDFVFYAGHGSRASGLNKPSLFLGNNPGFGRVDADDIRMGSSTALRNRYFMAHACALFPHFDDVHTPQGDWGDIFTGLRAMLGFESYIVDNPLGNHLFIDFWQRWTRDQQTLFDAFWTSEQDNGYAGLGGYGINPACLSATGDLDYCQLPFRHQPSLGGYQAVAGAGPYHSVAVGTPSYP